MTTDGATLRRILEGGPPEIDDVKARSAVAIRAGNQAIGSIWVVHEDDRLDDEAVHALAEAARIAVPHVIQARAARDVERRLRAELLLTVLEGRGSVEEAATRLGFAASAPLALVAFEIVGGEPGIDELLRERLVDLVVVHCDATCRQSAAVAIGQIVYALLQGDRPLDAAGADPARGAVAAHAETRLGPSLLAAAGPTVDGLREVPRARRDAERVLGVLRADPRGRTVASTEDVRSEVVLHELQELSLDHPGLTRGKLERVLAHDATHNATYAVDPARLPRLLRRRPPRGRAHLGAPEHVPLPAAQARRALRARPRRPGRADRASSCSSGCSSLGTNGLDGRREALERVRARRDAEARPGRHGEPPVVEHERLGDVLRVVAARTPTCRPAA